MTHYIHRESSVKVYLARQIQQREVLKKGEFKLNSEILSDYYYDFSRFNDAKGLIDLGFVISKTIKDLNLKFDILMGTAYKGIILCLATAMYSFQMEGKNVQWTFDRKEFKQHGEGGQLIGTDITNKDVLLVDDVVTSGKALQRAITTAQAQHTKSVQCLALIDRTTQKLPLNLYTVLTHKECINLLNFNVIGR